jgi:hypothetical protein
MKMANWSTGSGPEQMQIANRILASRQLTS